MGARYAIAPRLGRRLAADYYTLLTSVSWGDAIPSTQVSCQNMWLRADLFEVVNDVPVYKGYRFAARSVEDHPTYRIHAKRSGTTAPTCSVKTKWSRSG